MPILILQIMICANGPLKNAGELTTNIEPEFSPVWFKNQPQGEMMPRLSFSAIRDRRHVQHKFPDKQDNTKEHLPLDFRSSRQTKPGKLSTLIYWE